MRLAPVLIQPMASDDVARALAGVCVGAPALGVVEVAGPRQYRLDELVRYALGELQDPRVVVADPGARYFAAELEERILIPGENADLGEIGFEAWLGRRLATPVAVAR